MQFIFLLLFLFCLFVCLLAGGEGVRGLRGICYRSDGKFAPRKRRHDDDYTRNKRLLLYTKNPQKYSPVLLPSLQEGKSLFLSLSLSFFLGFRSFHVRFSFVFSWFSISSFVLSPCFFFFLLGECLFFIFFFFSAFSTAEVGFFFFFCRASDSEVSIPGYRPRGYQIAKKEEKKRKKKRKEGKKMERRKKKKQKRKERSSFWQLSFKDKRRRTRRKTTFMRRGQNQEKKERKRERE